jgi:hypothetical protein
MTQENEEQKQATGDGEPGAHRVEPGRMLAVRVGHGGNCSSVGSVIDTLFLGAAAGGAIFAAICAAMEEEKITVVGAAPAEAEGAEHDEE